MTGGAKSGRPKAGAPESGGRKSGETSPPADAARIVIVTGMSGAGKTSALKALEDLGYEAVDNLPLSLLSALASQAGSRQRPLAIGVDVRTRDFGVAPFIQELGDLIAERGTEACLVFLDSDDGTLQRRFTATRRRHPLAADRPLMDGIRHERSVLARLRARADLVIDTSSFTLGQLQAALDEEFGLAHLPGLAITVMSFSYGRGLPREADLVFDVRFLKNPYYEADLRPLTGRDAAVGAFIEKDDAFGDFFGALMGLLLPLVPRYEAEGKSYLTIALGCTGGRHRSVHTAERVAAALDEKGHRIRLRHRDVEGEAPPSVGA